MKFLRYAAIALAGLLALAVVGFAIARLVIEGPIGPLAGGRLGGTERVAPADWRFTDEYMTVAVEVRPADPHSVTVICFVSDGELYIPARDGAEKEWPKSAMADGRARVQVGDAVYPVQLVRILDESERQRAFASAAQKYPQLAAQSKGQIPDGLWLFRAERRH